jgi:diguanylate cyclase (GGDEF)-like protein/PAS domain S-box-containing protein
LSAGPADPQWAQQAPERTRTGRGIDERVENDDPMSGPHRDEANTTRRRAANLLLVVAPLAVGAAAAYEWSGVAWARSAVALAAALVVLFGSPRRGRSAGPWQLIGLGLLAFAGSGFVAASLAASRDAAGRHFPDLADVPGTIGLALIAAGVLTLASREARRIDWVARVDTAIGTVAATSLVTTLLISESERAHVLEPPERAAIGVIALVLALLAASATRFGVSGGARRIAGQRLLGGTAALFLGSTIWSFAGIEHAENALGGAGAGLLALGVVLLASAALHPTTSLLGRREERPAVTPSGFRLGLLTAIAVAGPASVLSLGLREGIEVNPVLLGVQGIALVVLFAVRLELMVRAARRWAQREVTMRDAAGAIGAARDASSIRASLLSAVGKLVGDDLRCLASVTFNDRGAPSLDELFGPRGELDPVASGVARVVPQLPADAGAPYRVHDPTAGELLVAPIGSRIAQSGALVLGVHGPAPDDLDESLAILGAQAALALDAAVQAEELHSKRSEARFQQIVRNSSDAILILDPEGRIRYQTPSVVRVLGFLAMDLEGARIDQVVHPAHAGHLEHFLAGLLRAGPQSVRRTDVQLLRADDSVIHAEVIGSNLVETPDVGGLVLTIRDVTGRRTLEDQLRHQAFHDSLTGLPNRALFIDRVDHALDRVRRAEDTLPAVVFIDLDDFKTVNDSLGHGAGDELLGVVADRLRDCLRSGDTPARLSGDEFAVLLEDAPDNAAVLEVAERVLDALQQPVTIEGAQVYVKASIGVATRKGPSTSSDELLRNADLAMYTAKANGKGCVALFEPSMHDRAVDRLAIKSELERSVNDRTIEVAYQPIVRLDNRRIVAFEALARWTHPVRGQISPVEFVPIAEDTGLILPLGRLVLERACDQLARWRRGVPGHDWRISVNLSARQLLAPDLVPMVRAATANTGLNPAAVTLELTESVLLSDSERVLRRLHDLKDLGVQIAIDDFGTGYSSLSYLQRVPFDVLKIDRAFVAALREGHGEATLVRTIMDLAHTLGRNAIAEGVEREVEVEGLRRLGCEYGQGFLFGRASDAATLTAEHGLLAS